MTDNQTMDIAWIINQQNKPLNEKAEFLKASFAQSSEKLDYVNKSGWNYVLGKLNIPENLEFRIWKTLDAPYRSMNAEYLYTGTDEDKAKEMFKSIIHGDIEKKITKPEEEEIEEENKEKK